VSNGVDQSSVHSLKQMSIVDFNLSQIIPHSMDELQAHTNTTFQPFGLKDDGYWSSSSFVATPKESPSSHGKVESSNAFIMPVMVTEVTNFKEQ